MKALVVTPGRKDAARLIEAPVPPAAEGGLLVEMLAIGVCGTDKEIIGGKYGWAPPGRAELVIGHEALGRVVETTSKAFPAGSLVAGIVRRPDPVPCSACAVGQWDMCENGRYTERGIKERDGFCSELFRLEPDFAIPVPEAMADYGVLVEPASVLAKAWQHTERIGQRAHFSPRRVLVTGAGPIGLLAALMATQKGFEVHVLDRVTEGPKPRLVEELGARYHSDLASLAGERHPFDIVIECTGAAKLVPDILAIAGPDSIVCLTGVSSGSRKIEIDIASISREMVLGNGVLFGSVNANRAHYELAVQTLARADANWLRGLITRRVPLARWSEAFQPSLHDVKTVIVSH